MSAESDAAVRLRAAEDEKLCRLAPWPASQISPGLRGRETETKKSAAEPEEGAMRERERGRDAAVRGALLQQRRLLSLWLSRLARRSLVGGERGGCLPVGKNERKKKK